MRSSISSRDMPSSVSCPSRSHSTTTPAFDGIDAERASQRRLEVVRPFAVRQLGAQVFRYGPMKWRRLLLADRDERRARELQAHSAWPGPLAGPNVPNQRAEG
jgi:hypothetical protein